MKLPQLDKMPKTEELEKKIQTFWDSNEFYKCNPKSDKDPFCIMFPPPNVTGVLHVGHAFETSIADAVVRYNRMKGKDVLWQPGTDHAGIATQRQVEKNLEKQKIRRTDLSREDFVKKVWEWKEKSGGQIIEQLKRLGASCDWSRERFTMDEGLSNAVRKTFVKMHKDGLIYKGKRMVNWCPKQNTAVSDLEVENKQENGKFWHIKYPLEDGSGFIHVATTRPETMMGDTAVAVNPKDTRYKNLIGKNCIVPLVGRIIPIISDEHADLEKGSGAVKITSAHDFDDYEVSKRHNLPIIQIMNFRAKMNENVPEKYRGMNRYVARKTIVEDLEKEGALEKIEDIQHIIPYSERGKVPVEPMLSDQWYVKVQSLADKAIEVVENKEIEFLPKHRENLYFSWMRDIRDWCISRQLWWGHQIPAWYSEDGTVFVEETEKEALESAKKHFGKKVNLTRDEDVLDTWFSSMLWPFSTLGWPEKTIELEKYYPNALIIPGIDIIFFWVARMIMGGYYLTGKVPFKTVHLHGIVRDNKGQKFSKSKGNGINPMDPVEKYGADALRHWAIGTSFGVDLRYDERDIKVGRKLVVKLWNASRFTLGYLKNFEEKKETSNNILIEDKWILGKLADTIDIINDKMEKYDTFASREILDKFFWNDFCDRYLEMVKERFWNEELFDDENRYSAQWTLWKVLRSILGLYAPFIPFVTEELYQQIYKPFEKTESIHITDFPKAEKTDVDISLMKEILEILDLTRKARTEQKIANSSKLAFVKISSPNINELKSHKLSLCSILRTTEIRFEESEKLSIDFKVKTDA